MTTTFTTLRTDQVDADVQTPLHMLWVSNHVHVKDAGLMEPLDDWLGWDANRRDEEFGTAVDNDADKFVQFALGVVVAGTGKYLQDLVMEKPYFVFRAFPPTCGIRRSTPKGAFLSFRKLLSSDICS